MLKKLFEYFEKLQLTKVFIEIGEKQILNTFQIHQTKGF
jgi:hypothetical protein